VSRVMRVGSASLVVDVFVDASYAESCLALILSLLFQVLKRRASP
jgi:hypothetical protein